MLHSILLLVLLLTSAYQVRPPEDIVKRRGALLAAKTYQGRRGQAMPYRWFVPQEYDQQKKYPLVVYLHGGGGIGRDNLKQIQGGNGFLIDLFTSAQTQTKYPCFVIAPQSHDEGWVGYDDTTPSEQLGRVLELIEHLQQTYSIDRERLYVAGQSLGGFGTFGLLTLRPNLFAAAVPICGGGDEAKAGLMVNVPIWAFHGEKDEAVSVERSRRMIAAVRKAGGKPKYTEYRGEGHLIWQKVVREPELLPWLFSQRRAR
jgi:predicted peptidase